MSAESDPPAACKSHGNQAPKPENDSRATENNGEDEDVVDEATRMLPGRRGIGGKRRRGSGVSEAVSGSRGDGEPQKLQRRQALVGPRQREPGKWTGEVRVPAGAPAGLFNDAGPGFRIQCGVHASARAVAKARDLVVAFIYSYMEADFSARLNFPEDAARLRRLLAALHCPLSHGTISHVARNWGSQEDKRLLQQEQQQQQALPRPPPPR